jgi:hypothetical protein
MENLKNTQMLNESVLLKTTPFKTCDIIKYHKLPQITDIIILISQYLRVGQFCIDVYSISTFERTNFSQIQC